MECSNHTEREAVAACRGCGKGLCAECAVEVGDAFSCQGQCEIAVRALNEAAHRSERKVKLLAGGSMSALLLLGALACFGIVAKETLTTQRANLDEDGNFHVDPPITLPVTKTEKIAYATGGVLLLVGGVYGFVTTLRIK